jgi:alkyl sulfatase BDS1-like metallo-beta-lactamase superfamily hydrolase
VHNVYKLPDSILKHWHCRGYHGSPEHNSRGVIQRFLGFWDGNPTTLIPAPQNEVGKLFVEMMGGAEKIIAKGRELHDQGKYKFAQEIVNKLVQAQPQNQTAKDLLADIFEQLGYQQENPGLRNSFLAAAYELRTGIPQGEFASTSSPDVIRSMSTELFLNFLAIRMDSRKAEGMEFTINLITPDNGEKFLIELSNATLNNIKGFQAEKADLTITINRSDLELSMMGAKPIEAQIKDGTAKVQGDISILAKLASTMVEFDPRFEIMPGTKARTGDGKAADVVFEAPVGAAIAE